MPQVAAGVDIIEIGRVESVIKRYGKRFLQRVFTPRELDEVEAKPASLAARFAAKEAVAKALGTGIGPVAWHEIEVVSDASGKPGLCLHGSAQRVAGELGLSAWSLSLSHTHSHAVAIAVAMGVEIS